MLNRVFVTGCAGFIGSNLCNYLADMAFDIVGIDNLSTGRIKNIQKLIDEKAMTFYKEDLTTLPVEYLAGYMRGCSTVYHLSANADVRFGLSHTGCDMIQNTLVTHRVLEAMRLSNTRKIVFTSTGSVYGDTKVVRTPEDAPFPMQTSLYGASKLACEGMIEAYCEGFGISATILRLVGILGKNYSHGHIIDFYRQLKEHPEYLTILGNGSQVKSYLHVNDCIHGMVQLACYEGDPPIAQIFNLGTEGTITVTESASIIADAMGVHPEFMYASKNNRGWIGDNPLIYLDCFKANAHGWFPKEGIRQSIVDTVNYLQEEHEKT
jgi:UDP-glucose 4-epimerase